MKTKTSMSKDELADYIRQRKIDMQNAKASIFAADIVYETYVLSNKVPGLVFSPVMCYHLENDEFFQLIPWEKIIALTEALYEQAMKNPDVIKKEIREHLETEEKLDSEWGKVKDYEKLPDDKFSAFFKTIIKLASVWWTYGIIGEDHGKIIDEKIVPFIENTRKLSRAEAIKLVSVLSHPKEQSIFTGERKSFFEMCVYCLSNNRVSEAVMNGDLNIINKDKVLMKMFDDYKKRFFYAKTDFYDRKIIDTDALVADIRKEAAGKTADDFREELRKIEEGAEEIENEKKKLLKTLRLSPEEKSAIWFASQIVDWHDKRKRGMMKQFYYTFSLLHELARRKGISYSIAADFTVTDVIDVLDGKLEPPKKERDKSIHLLILFEKGLKPQFFRGNDAKELLELCRGERKEEEIRGAVASTGTHDNKKIEGIVRVVKDPMKDEFKKGEILVTSMTRIEFVPLMKKAKAIITNEGGIACHAAIVSRELGVPCITGTKVATRLLKSGDTIEMDLEKGVVKKLK